MSYWRYQEARNLEEYKKIRKSEQDQNAMYRPGYVSIGFLKYLSEIEYKDINVKTEPEKAIIKFKKDPRYERFRFDDHEYIIIPSEEIFMIVRHEISDEYKDKVDVLWNEYIKSNGLKC